MFRLIKFHVALQLLCLFLLSFPVVAAASEMVEIETPQEVGVGKAFFARITSWYPLENLTVSWNGKTVKPSVKEDKGKYSANVLLGIGLRQETGAYHIGVTASVWGHLRQFGKSVKVVETEFQKETLTVEPKMVIPPDDVLERIKQERAVIIETLNIVSPRQRWEFPFSRPVKGKMLSRFGLYRTFNGHTKGRHTGLDFRAWLGTPIHSMAAGTVVLVGNFYYGGNCTFIDHGNGFVSMYAHMSRVFVKEGDEVGSGQKVGLSGATGRVTGAHLHLATFVLGKVVDPEPFFDGQMKMNN